MIKEIKAIYITFFFFILCLFRFLVSGNTLILFVSLGMLGAALMLIIYIKKYNPKYYLVFIPFFMLQGLTLVYTYLFQLKTLELPYMILFYFFAVIWILFASLLILGRKAIYKDLKKNREDLKINN
jgi:hypothetical protein